MKQILFLIILLLPCLSPGQTTDDVWKPFRAFIGNWKGDSEGQPGKGTYDRTYKFIFDDKFIEVRNTSTYPKQEKNPKGEIHEDIGYLSYDKARKTFVLRQFHKEGFVIQYKLASVSADGKTIVFDSESIENVPAGWRARETLNVKDDGEWTETFELAAQNAEYKLYSKATLKRVKK